MGKSLKISPVNFTWFGKDYSFTPPIVIPALICCAISAASSKQGATGAALSPHCADGKLNTIP